MAEIKKPVRKTTVEDIRARIRSKGADIVVFMNNPIGKSVVNALEETFYDGEIVDENPYMTYYNLGRRDVVSYMKQLQRIAENEDGD